MSQSARTTDPQYSGFARLSPWAARAVLLVTAATMLFFANVSTSSSAINYAAKPRRSAGDIALYLAEVQRISRGENYYKAANHELRERGYPTRSVFNWRTPLPMWLLGMLPSEAARRAMIGIFAVVLLGLGMHVATRERNVPSG